MGLAAVFLSEPWWPSTLGFLSYSIIGQGLTITAYFVIAAAFIPCLVFFWLLTVSNLLFEEKKAQIIGIAMIICIIFEAIFLAFVFTNPLTFGTISGYFDPNFGLFVRAFQITAYLIMGITALLFILELNRSDTKDSKFKARFLTLGFVFFLTGSVIDIYALMDFPSVLSVVLVIIGRLLLVICEIFLYFGLTLPQFIKNIFIKDG